jgi:RimJ/RimL family protein N-acetyltransferase
VPLEPRHAAEMVEVLADPVLYAFTGGDPPDLADLEGRYRTWAEGSPRANESWLNWIVRLGAGGPAIGHLQATVVDDGEAADIAWLIGTAWQGRGYASEAARALVGWLEGRGVGEITAHIHEDHAASGRVAAAAGLEPTAEIQGGEVVWRRSR